MAYCIQHFSMNLFDFTFFSRQIENENEDDASSTVSNHFVDDRTSSETSNGSARSTTPESDDVSEPAQKKRRIHKSFEFVNTFNTEAEALASIQDEKCWSKYYKSTSAEGDRQLFRCNKVKFRGDQCAASLYLLFDARNPVVHLYRSTNEYTHETNINRICEIPDETKKAIKDMFDIGINKPSIFINKLMMQKIELPDKRKFDSYLKKLRSEKFGSDKIDLADLKNWLQDNTVIPIDKNKSFVVDFDVSLDEKNPYFRFIISTTSDKVHTDGTYKCNWQGYPVLQIGTTDMHRSYHPFGVAVTKNERADDYAFLFESIKKGLKNVYNIDYKPNILICDAADAIKNGFIQVFGEHFTTSN